MSKFQDSEGREWSIRFDGMLLAGLQAQHGINLADVTGASYLAIERDMGQLVAAVLYLVSDQLKPAKVSRDQFVQSLAGQPLDDALTAIWEAAASFFPPAKLSNLQSAFSTLRGQWEAMGPCMLLLNQPGVPPMMAEALARTMMAASTSSASSAAGQSATGPDASQSSAATD